MRLALATLWVLTGSALTAGVYWGFLVTPESTIWALAASAILAIVALAMAGVTANGTIAIWSHGASAAGLRGAVRAMPGVIPATLIVLLVWWMTGRAETWVARYSGQINAWFISRVGWDDVSWLYLAIRLVWRWFRWVIAPLLALSLMAGFVAIGWRSMMQAAWLRRALRPRAVAGATVWFAVLIELPWMYLVPWRPGNLPASSVEFAFIVAKLSIAAILFAIGAALIVYEASRVPTQPLRVA